MKKFIVLSVVVIAVSGWMGCESKKELTTAAAACDTSNVRYSMEIQTILATHCYVCHASNVAAVSGNGNKLDSYANLKPYATNGLLVNVVSQAPGFPAMPENAPKLSDCDIAKIRIWVSSGALNN